MNLISEIGFNLPIKEIILQAGTAAKAGSICKKYGKTLLVCDENTKDFIDIGGERLILPGSQKPELEFAKQIAKHSPDCFIAVGSGSLNDIVKYASFLANKPYIVFGTAPSMNGYVSANASLLENGYKKSFTAHAPDAVYLDLEILENAPQRLIISGVGDSICRSTAQADVLLSAQATKSERYENLFALMRKYENDIFDNIEALTKTLIFSGIAMLVAKSSAPASQGEHMLAHYMELMQPEADHSFHGEQIAVTTITMAQMQENLLNEQEYIEVSEIPKNKILNHFGKEFGQYCIEQTNKKYGKLNNKIKLNKKSIEQVMLKSENIKRALSAIDAPLKPADIGWDNNIYDDAINFARYTRDRFTFLDLV